VTYPRIGVGFGGFDLPITAITCDVGDSGDFWLTAMFSKTLVHPPLRATSLYRIFAGESITNQDIVLLPSGLESAANHAPAFLLACARTPILKRPFSVSQESVHWPKTKFELNRCAVQGN
jgi:hypothetical protein